MTYVDNRHGDEQNLEIRGVRQLDWNLFKRYSRREHVLDRKNERDRERVFCCENSPNGRSIQVHEAFEGNQAQLSIYHSEHIVHINGN